MDKCKCCLNIGTLELIKDFKYQHEEDDPIEVFDVFKCSICGCIHWQTQTSNYYEYVVRTKEEINNVGEWKI